MPSVELRHLRAFVAIAEHRHYGRAAASIKVTQPAITQRIQVLEAELGVRLLERNAREVRLTAAGEALLEHARGLVQLEDRAVAALRDHSAGIVGRLRFSYLTLWDVGLPAQVVAEYRRCYPAIKLEMTSGYSQQNIERLLADEIDFAFIGVSIGHHDGIVIRRLTQHKIVVVMAPTHRLMQFDTVPIAELRGEPLISTSPGVNAPLVASSLSWLTMRMGEPPNIVREEPPDQMAAALAESEGAIALMTEHRAEIARSDGLEYRQLTPTPLIEYGGAYRHDNRSPVLANLLKTIDEVAPALPGDVAIGAELWVV
jgi:DNA-binding transcriptional LysR family regulator